MKVGFSLFGVPVTVVDTNVSIVPGPYDHEIPEMQDKLYRHDELIAKGKLSPDELEEFMQLTDEIAGE